MVNEFISNFKKENEVSYLEILKKGYSNSDIEILISQGIIEKKDYNIYKLLKHKTVADYINLAKGNEKSSTNVALYYFKQAAKLENNPYIYFRMLKVLIRQKDYEETLKAIEKMLEYDKTGEFKNRAYIILMILKELTPVSQELINQVKIDKLVNNASGSKLIAFEEYFDVIRKIEDGNYCLAYKGMKSLTTIPDNKALYIHDVIRTLLEQVNIQKNENAQLLIQNSSRNYLKEIKKLYKIFLSCLNNGDYSKALKVMSQISFLAQQIMPNNFSNDTYSKYIILLKEIDGLLQKNISTQRDYSWKENSFYQADFSLRRLIEEHDFQKALAITKFQSDNEFQVITQRLLIQIDFLTNELNSSIKDLMGEKNSCLLKDYLVKTIPNQQILQRVYTYVAQEYYQEDNQDRGDYFLDKAQQLSFEKGPILSLQNKNSSN